MRRHRLVLAAVAAGLLLPLLPLFSPSASAFTTGDTSPYAPAIAECTDPSVFQGTKMGYVVFTGGDSLIHVIVFSPGNSASWHGYTTSTHAASAVSITCLNSGNSQRLLATWRTSNGSVDVGQLVAANNHKGYGFLSVASPGATTGAAPAIASNNTGYAVAWAGTDSQHHINVWAGPNRGTFITTDYTRSGAGVSMIYTLGPSGAAYYLAWIAAVGTPHIYVGSFAGTTSLGAVVTSDYSPQAPIFDAANIDLVNSNSNILLNWLGSTNKNFYIGAFDGTGNLGSSPYKATGNAALAGYTDIGNSTPDCHDAFIDTANKLHIDEAFGC
ncbi:MAG TPA: hypothetical protein VF070_02510 [Streptosporangiaceae bacterium]